MKLVLVSILTIFLAFSSAPAQEKKPEPTKPKAPEAKPPAPPTAPTPAAHPTTPPATVDKSKVVARVGDYKITLKDLDDILSQYPPQFRTAFTTFERKKNLVETLIDNKLFALAAEREGLDKDPDVQKQVQTARERILNFAYYKKISNGITVSDEEAKQYYDAHQKEFTTPEQIKARHILVKTEDEAKAIKADLDKGGNFEEIAKQKSTDKITAPRGGDLGLRQKGFLGVGGPDFEKAAFALEVGKISDPVKTNAGYHIIKVEEKRPPALRDFEKEKQNIIRRLKNEKERQAVDNTKKKLRQEMRASIDEELIKATVQPANEPPPAPLNPLALPEGSTKKPEETKSEPKKEPVKK